MLLKSFWRHIYVITHKGIKKFAYFYLAVFLAKAAFLTPEWFQRLRLIKNYGFVTFQLLKNNPRQDSFLC